MLFFFLNENRESPLSGLRVGLEELGKPMPSKRDPESSSNVASLAARLVEPPLDLEPIRRRIEAYFKAGWNYMAPEDQGWSDFVPVARDFYAEAVRDIPAMIAEIERLQAGRLVDPSPLKESARSFNEDEAIKAAEHCSHCGGPYTFDVSIPSVRWNAVIRASGLTEYLCATCILREFARRGESFTAVLSGDGFHLLPIEVVVNGQAAKDVEALNGENNRLRCRVRELETLSSAARVDPSPLAQLDLEPIRRGLASDNYHHREDWGSTDLEWSAKGAIEALLTEVDRLRAALLVPTQPIENKDD